MCLDFADDPTRFGIAGRPRCYTLTKRMPKWLNSSSAISARGWSSDTCCRFGRKQREASCSDNRQCPADARLSRYDHESWTDRLLLHRCNIRVPLGIVVLLVSRGLLFSASCIDMRVEYSVFRSHPSGGEIKDARKADSR
jgi:hypothetical protein